MNVYSDLQRQTSALLAGESDLIANTANIASLVYHSLRDVNWVGFYFMRDGELVLGPFQGRPACVRIPLGKGVCGTAAAEGRSIVVEDVNAFPGHIACDAASRSELVVPIRLNGAVAAVLDVDSPTPARFGDADRAGLEAIVSVIEAHHAADDIGG